MSRSDAWPALRLPSWPRVLLAGLAAAVLAGCATPRAPTPTQPGRESAWSGRFSVTWSNARETPEERAGGRFLLADDAGATRLEVFSPLGQTLVRADAGPSGARLETADGRVFEADSADALTENLLGWRAPVSRLSAWLRGDYGASPNEAAATTVEDSGWNVTVEQWAQAPQGGRALPKRLALSWPSRPGTDPRRVRILLLVDRDEP